MAIVFVDVFLKSNLTRDQEAAGRRGICLKAAKVPANQHARLIAQQRD
jgi:hypothetical protein